MSDAIDPGIEHADVDVEAALSAGTTTFLGIELLCAPGVLVPRPETELLASTAIAALSALGGHPVVIDMCCGAGNLACAIAVHVPNARVWAADLTDDCVGLARRNVVHLGLGDRVQVRQGDLFDAFGAEEQAGLLGSVDLVVCNPPYISVGRLESERAELLAHEPREAFDAGPYGIAIHQRVVRDAAGFLVDGGLLAFEIGLGQERQVLRLLERAGSYHDLSTLTAGPGGPIRGATAHRVARATDRAYGVGT